MHLYVFLDNILSSSNDVLNVPTCSDITTLWKVLPTCLLNPWIYCPPAMSPPPVSHMLNKQSARAVLWQKHGL